MAMKEEVIREGLIVTLGQNMFSLPKLQWFSLRTSGLFYSARAKSNPTGETGPESMIEFETMFVRVENVDEENSKFTHRADKIAVYCLRVGDKRKCRILCFISWEERDFWMISVLHAIAQFKILNQGQVKLCGKIRYSSSFTPRSRPGKPFIRLARSECEGKSIRKRFSSLRSRKSLRSSRDSDLNETVLKKTARSTSSEVFSESNSGFYNAFSHSFSQIEERGSAVFCEMEEAGSQSNDPPSPRYKPWFEKLSFSAFITKFT